jgi:hypothetical protein
LNSLPRSHALENGQLYAWGCDLFFQLGNGKGEDTHVPALIGGELEGKKVEMIGHEVFFLYLLTRLL